MSVKIVPGPDSKRAAFAFASDGTAAAIEPGSATFPLCQTVIDRQVVVDEGEIANGIRLIAETEHWMVEGAAGMALAGLVRSAQAYRGARVAVVLCGRNIAPRTFASIVGRC